MPIIKKARLILKWLAKTIIEDSITFQQKKFKILYNQKTVLFYKT